jgi:hypothetical protein
MATLIKLSPASTSLALIIDTAISRAQAARFAGKYEITAIFIFEGVTFRVKIDSDPSYLIHTFQNRPPDSNDVIGPYAAEDS